MNPRRYVAPVMEKTIKLASDSAPVATQIVQDIENYSTNVIRGGSRTGLRPGLSC